MKKEFSESAKGLLRFIDSTPTPYHAAEKLTKMLEKAGAVKLTETDRWEKLVPGKIYFFVRNDTCTVAFRLGSGSPAETGWHVSLSHLDYPCLRVRPDPSAVCDSYERIGAETYGGLIHHSWFNRPLSLAGRVYVRDGYGQGLNAVNINVARPLLVIPELAIHMNGGVNENAKFNPQTELIPIFSQDFENRKSFIEFIAKKAEVKAEDILSYDLSVYDASPSVTAGADNEFISAPHLDNGEMVYCSFKGFIDSSENECSPDIGSMVIAYDHEEVGSVSDRGARSDLLSSVLSRIHENIGLSSEDLRRAQLKTVICSADMAHASHPSYPGTFDADHKVFVNKGPVLKHSFSQKYIESPKAAALFRKFCADNGIPFQEFVNRNDAGGGSTVGPASASAVGAIGFDIGNAIFSMHSIREFGGTKDVEYALRFFRAFHR